MLKHPRLLENPFPHRSGRRVDTDIVRHGKLKCEKRWWEEYAKDREEDECEREDENEGEIVFEMTIDSPYIRPLTGTPLEWKRGFVDGMCPLCNNERHGQIDHEIMENLGKTGLHTRFGISENQLAVHIASHIGMVYSEQGRLLADLDRHDDKKTEERIRKGVKVSKQLEVLISREKRAADAVIVEIQTGEPSFLEEDDERPLRPDSRVAMYRGVWYAYDGKTVRKPLRPWTKERTMEEMIVRERDAINFFDEMLDIRAKSCEVYEEAMTPQARIDKNGNEYETKDLSVALSALRERRSVAETMVKVGLIANRIGGGKDGQKRELSPEMKSMIADLGIFSHEEEEDPLRIVKEEP